jgi:hypothetical protein
MRSFIFAFVGLLFLLLPVVVGAQNPPGFCGGAGSDIPNDVVLDVSLNGRGMVWPNLITQVFFRLHEDGRIEYDSRTPQHVTRHIGRLDDQTLNNLLRLANSSDLLNADQMYPRLEDLKDATLRTCITLNRWDLHKRILVVNYMVGHPSAKGYYPNGLIELTRMVAEIRPKTKYERKHGLVEPGLPY